MQKSREIPINQIISRVKHLEIRARKLVKDSLSSDYHSVFKGRGIEFNEVRNYFIGDDVRDIDWNVTARMNEPYIKTYIEERELTVLFAVDVSHSSYFGSSKSKREMMAEIVALLGFASFFNNDKAGLVLFSEDIEKVVKPNKNYSHLLRIIRDSWYYESEKKGTNLAKSMQSLYTMQKKKAIIFILSDFLDTGYEKMLLGLSNKHEVIPIVVHDTQEERWERDTDNDILANLPLLVDIEDIEDGKTKTIDLALHTFTELDKFKEYYRKLFKMLSLDYAEVNNRYDYFKTIEMLLRKRMKSKTGGTAFSGHSHGKAVGFKETIIVKDKRGSASKLQKCADILKSGGLVAFPTETVYGLGANALEERAVHKIFEAKGRKSDNPLIVHIADVSELPRVAAYVPDIARKLLQAFAPGPLTVVLPKNNRIPNAVTAGLPTVAIRIPDHPVARRLIQLSGVPIAAPSANISGRLSPTSFEMTYQEMNGIADAIIDGGECQLGLESTVVTIVNNQIKILRPGAITEEMIRNLLFETLGDKVFHDMKGVLETVPLAPGMKYSHYKPKCPVYLTKEPAPEKIIEKLGNKKIGILGYFPKEIADSLARYEQFFVIRFDSLPHYAHELYRAMDALDKEGVTAIVAVETTEKSIGRAIMNRLSKSSDGNRV